VVAGAGGLRISQSVRYCTNFTIFTHRPLKISPKGNSGRSDVSQNHDLYLTGLKK
jgi:hypothetical protein